MIMIGMPQALAYLERPAQDRFVIAVQRERPTSRNCDTGVAELLSPRGQLLRRVLFSGRWKSLMLTQFNPS